MQKEGQGRRAIPRKWYAVFEHKRKEGSHKNRMCDAWYSGLLTTHEAEKV